MITNPYGIEAFLEYLELDHIPYIKKINLAHEYLTLNQAITWSIMCSESIMFKYTIDDKLSKCFELLKSIKDFENIDESVISNARSLFYSALSSDRINTLDILLNIVYNKEQEKLNLEFLKKVLNS